MGKAVRAATFDMLAASLLGINTIKVCAFTFGLGLALAGIAGICVALTYPFDPYFGFIFSLKALIAVAFGGIGHVLGSFLGGLSLGIIENISSYLFGGVWEQAISYAAFLLVLMLRPQGLFGGRE